MPDFLKTLGDGIFSTIEAPINAVQGNFGAAVQNVEDAFSRSIHAVDQIPVIGPYIGPAVASYFGGPLGYAAASGIRNGVEASFKGAPWQQAALSGAENAGISYGAGQLGAAAGQYAGNALQGSDLGSFLQSTPAANAGNVIGGDAMSSLAPIGSFAGNAFGGTTTGEAIGSFLGHQSADNATAYNPAPSAPGIAAFSPSQSPQVGIPQSLSQFGSLSPQQQSSNIASKGVYGGGQGPDETNYFLNLMNRQLFDQGGNVAQNTNGIAPVDMSFLNQLGISGSSPTDLLKGISQYGQA